MRILGFPLAPMVIGVVLGNIAELNLARALAITTDLSPFVTRPWSLFFLTLGLFSTFFPKYQGERGKKKWTLVYPSFIAVGLSVPLFMMGGMVRPLLAGGLLVMAGYFLWTHHRNGWRLESVDTPVVSIQEP
jgi:putative tricarboxylic transport membrane protein